MEDIEPGYCQCGCGKRTEGAYLRNRKDLGHIKGQPVRFLRGHGPQRLKSRPPSKRRPERRKPITERILERIDKDENGCWLWRGYVGPTGYAVLTTGSGESTSLQRASYEAFRGAIPEGMVVDHLCRVRHCGNPWHLEPVANRENLMRGESPSAKNARRTQCPYGHAYDQENTYYDSRGWRQCKTCWRQRP